LSKIGSYPATSLAEARKRFHAEFDSALQTKRDIRHAKTQRPGTIRELFDSYAAQLKSNGKRSYDDAEYNLTRLMKSLDADAPANTLTAEQVSFVLRPIYKRGARSMADHMRSYVRSAYAWAIRTELDYRNDAPKRFYVRDNPCVGIPTEPKVAGHRWLSVDELREFWRWLHVREAYNPKANHAISESNQRAIRLLILTGQRVEMIAGVRAGMFDGACIEWSTTKNGLPHVLPIPEQAKRELVEANEHGLYFPMITRANEPVTNGVLYSITRRFVARTGVEPFSPRDLRRTWKTLAGKAGISKEVRDLIQHHARSDVSSRHYDRYEYLNEKREGMQRWSEWFRSEIETAPPK
jgi:integrase